VIRVLKIPVYRRLLAAYALNELAFMIGALTLALLVYRRTGSAFGATAFFLVSQFVPALISPMAVARLEDRPVRGVLPSLYWLEAVLFLVLAWLADGHFSLVAVLALSLLDGIGALTARSLARAATVSVTSPAGLLREGNALANGAFSICFMLGPAVGGVLVAVGSTSIALLVDACLFGMIGLTLATCRRLPEPARSRSSAKGRVRAALAYARDRPVIRGLLMVQAAALLFFTISVPVEVVFVQHTLHAGAGGYGALMSAWGAGAVAGAAVYARWRGLPPRDLIAVGAFALGVGFLVMAMAPTIVVAVVGGAIAGVGNGIEAVAARTALQEQVEQKWMALMMSLNDSMFQSVPGAGILLGGAITALGSPRAAFFVAGVGSLAITVAAFLVLSGLATARETAVASDGVREPRYGPPPGAGQVGGQRYGQPAGPGRSGEPRPGQPAGPGRSGEPRPGQPPAPDGAGEPRYAESSGPGQPGEPHQDARPAPAVRHQ
jgi:MFS family permease